jgi:hypothetical protein
MYSSTVGASTDDLDAAVGLIFAWKEYLAEVGQVGRGLVEAIVICLSVVLIQSS